MIKEVQIFWEDKAPSKNVQFLIKLKAARSLHLVYMEVNAYVLCSVLLKSLEQYMMIDQLWYYDGAVGDHISKIAVIFL